MSLEDFFTETLIAKVRTYANVKGTRVPSESEVTIHAAVQPMSASRSERHGLEASEMGYTCYASSWPAGLGVGDVVEWTDTGKTLTVLGPPRDEGGADQVFGLDCVENT